MPAIVIPFPLPEPLDGRGAPHPSESVLPPGDPQMTNLARGVPTELRTTGAVQGEDGTGLRLRGHRVPDRGWRFAANYLTVLQDRAGRLCQQLRRRHWLLLSSDRGAVTAEYAIVILAAVAFAGLLVAIMRSDEVRAMLVGLVQNALGAAG